MRLSSKHLAAVTAVSAAGVLLPAAGASADTTTPAPASTSKASPVFTFIPPKVGPLQVSIGATYIGGKLISPGVDVSTPGVSLPPIIWSPRTP